MFLNNLACRDKYTDRYNMDHKRRGLAVIINNVDFKGKGKRVGSDVDYAELKRALESLGFDVETHKDKTVSQMSNILTSGKFRGLYGVKWVHHWFVFIVLMWGTYEGLLICPDTLI